MENLQNKYFSIIGDSISTLEGYIPPEHAVYYNPERMQNANIHGIEDTWWGQVIAQLGGKLLMNDSFSGSTAVIHPACFVDSYTCTDQRTSYLHKGDVTPDVIMIYMGTNDRGICAKPLATEESEKSDLSVFSTAYATMLQKLRANYPAAKIWCLTLPVCYCSANDQFAFPYEHGGWHIEQFCKAIRDCAQQYGCRVIDLYAQTKENPYDSMDGCHPNAEGMKTISAAVLAELAK